MKKTQFVLKTTFAVLIIGLMISSASANAPKAAKENLVLWGSTSVQPIMAQVEDIYEAYNTSIDIQYGGSGSGDSIPALDNGFADIGMASSRRSVDLNVYREYVIAFDGIAIIVNTANTVDELTKAQVKDIFTGEITNWSELGGSDGEIVVIRREEGSGTNDYFVEKVIDDEDYAAGAHEQKTNLGVHNEVSSTPNAIGYISLGYIDSEIATVDIAKEEGDAYVTPSAATVIDKTYPISRELYFYTKGDPNQISLDFMLWLNSTQGSCEIYRAGYVPLNPTGDCPLDSGDDTGTGSSIPGFNPAYIMLALGISALLISRKVRN